MSDADTFILVIGVVLAILCFAGMVAYVLNNECHHRWTKWAEHKNVLVNNKEIGTVQKRVCLKCNKIETIRISF